MRRIKSYLKELLWNTGLYGQSRNLYRSLNPKSRALEQEEIKFYQNLIKNGDLVFDVGAHLGDKTKAFLACGAEVVAIEPETRFIKTIENRFSNQSKLRLVTKGLAATPGKLSYYRRDVASTSGFVKEWVDEWTEIDQVSEIEVTTLNVLCEEFGQPQYIKIDVEGFELEVLKGLSSPIQLISFEFFLNDSQRGLSCINLLSELYPRKFNLALMDNSKFFFETFISKTELEKFIFEDWDTNKYGNRGDIYVQKMDE